MKTLTKLNLYRDKLLRYKRAMDENDAFRLMDGEPLPESFNLKGDVEKQMAQKIREEVLGE